MNVEYYKEYSFNLGRDMEFKVYGHSGRPILVFPSQDGKFYDYENNGMVDAASDFIESGEIQLFCADSNDVNSWSSTSWDNRWKIEQHEAYYRYICDELCPRIFDISARSNGGNYPYGIMTTGCSMGASHALNFLLRRPDIFSGCLCLSGVYKASFFFGDYMDDLVYANSPINYLEGMTYDHPFVEAYRQKEIILCVGRGAYEEPMQEDTEKIRELFAYKNIPAWIDFWGNDVNHDWPWWRVQLPYYLAHICK